MAIGLSAEAPMAATTTTTAVRNGMDLGQSTKSRTQQRMHKRANVMVTMKSTGNDILAKIKGQSSRRAATAWLL